MISRTLFLTAMLGAAIQGCPGGSGGTPAPPAEAAPAETPSTEPGPDVTRPDAATAERLEAIYRARMDSALMYYHEADVHFMTGMINHHAQALAMCGIAPDNGASETIRTLCARIINAQQDEINLMQTWLRDRELEVPEIHVEAGHLTIHGPAHAMHMPGMLTDEEMEQLRQARGSDYDRLFLQYMIKHHKGAVTMVLELFATDGGAQDDFIFKLASDIQADQGSEIDRMEQMLEALGGANQ